MGVEVTFDLLGVLYHQVICYHMACNGSNYVHEKLICKEKFLFSSFEDIFWLLLVIMISPCNEIVIP